MNNIWDEFARYIFNVEVSVEQEQAPQPAQQWRGGGSTTSTGRLNYSGGHSAQGRDAIAAAADGAIPAEMAEAADMAADEVAGSIPIVETRRLDEHEKLGRNDPCWCGSGKKFKKCHGA
jgi:preprotein translocase subunit SecA